MEITLSSFDKCAGSQNSRFVNLHNSMKLQNLHTKKQKIQNNKNYKKNRQNNYKITQNCCKSGSFLMIADPVVLCNAPLWSSAVFSHTRLFNTRSSAIAEGPRDASCKLKSCQLPRNSAETSLLVRQVLNQVSVVAN